MHLLLQQHVLYRSKMLKNPITFGRAECKVVITFLYHLILVVLALTAFTVASRNFSYNRNVFLEYLNCQKLGQNSTCSLATKTHPIANMTVYILLGLFPAISLVFAVNVKEIKSSLKQIRTRFSQRMSMKISEFRSDNTATLTFRKSINSH